MTTRAKRMVTWRLDHDLIEMLQVSRPSWQSKPNATLRKALNLRTVLLAWIVVASLIPGAALAQPRTQRPAPPPAVAAAPEATTLYQRDNTPYAVTSERQRAGDLCMIYMLDEPTKAVFTVAMDGSNGIAVMMHDYRPENPLGFSRPGISFRLSVEVDGNRQIYNIKSGANSSAGADLTRASQDHLRAAINHRAGLNVTLADGAPLHFVVPVAAARAFDACVSASLRSRMDQGLSQLRRSAEELRRSGNP